MAHGDEEVGLMLSSRIEWEYQAVKKWPLRKNVGHADVRTKVTLGRRTSEGERERSQMIGWDPKTEVGFPSPQRK